MSLHLVEIKKISANRDRNLPILAGSMRFLFLIIAVCSLNCAFGQYLDLAKVEYTYLPGSNANFEYQRQRVLFNFPFKLKKNSYFFVGLDYSNIQFEYKEDQDSYDKSNAENFKSLDLVLSYTFQLNFC